jgi:hypothetical protein
MSFEMAEYAPTDSVHRKYPTMLPVPISKETSSTA